MNVKPVRRKELESFAHLACLLEATARKPGNVHPQAAFEDLTYHDFLHSAKAIAPIIAATREKGVGQTILTAIERTHAENPKNTNLGIVLLLAPLAAVPEGVSLKEGIGDVLKGLTQEDARLVYQAIRVANPGGMGDVPEEDVSEKPTITLLEAMQLAADRDTIAAQYADNFDLVLNFGVPLIEQADGFPDNWEEAIIDLHLRLMARCPDTLIARKCGRETARHSSHLAQKVLNSGWPGTKTGQRELKEFDDWLRADGHKRNPGTTADLVAAVLFAAFRDGRLTVPTMEQVIQNPNTTEMFPSQSSKHE